MSNENYWIWQVSYVGSPKKSCNEIKPTQAQRELADTLGIKVTDEDTFAVVASHILERIGNEIGSPPSEVSEKQLAKAQELGIDVSSCSSSWSAYIKINEAIRRSNLDAVRRMGLKPGDEVLTSGGQQYVVSSVGEDGRVYFKGGRGKQSPASQLTKLTPPD